MMQLRWSTRVEFESGPVTTATGELQIEAFDRVMVEVPAQAGAAAGTRTVEVQPGGAGQVLALALSASDYRTPLSYTIDGGAAPGNKLDAPLLLVGQGAVNVLGATVRTFTFSNTSPNPIVVDLLVGRDATP